MKGKGIESIFDATHQWFPLSYWVTYERLCFLFFGALFPPNCYKCLYFFLVALDVIPELYKFSFPVIFTWPECAPGTLSSSQGPNSFLPLVTLTLAVLCLLLLHRQDRSCYLVSSHTLSANATCTFEHLARLFPDLTWVPVPGWPCSTAIHSEAGEELQLLKQKQPPLSHQVFSLFESENSKTTKAPQLFIHPQISIFLSPYAKF